MKAEEFNKNLENFTGTEQYHTFRPYSILLTDGIKYFCGTTRTYGILEQIATTLLFKRIKEPFVLIKIKNRKGCLTIILEDGNGNVLSEKTIAMFNLKTLPQGEWKFYLVNNVIMLPNEY